MSEKKPTNFGDIFLEEEEKSLKTTRHEISEEDYKYATDAAYRASVDAQREKKLEDFEALASLPPDEEEPDEEEPDEEDEEDGIEKASLSGNSGYL